MSNFLQTVRGARVLGANRDLRSYPDVFNLMIAADYPVARWMNDGAVNRDERTFFKTIVTRRPYLSNDENLRSLSESSPAEFYFAGDQAPGLAAALTLDGLALSLYSEARWDAATLPLEVIQLDDDGEVKISTSVVRHASTAAHLAEHRDWIGERQRLSVSSGEDLWNRRGELFPSLIYCESAGEHILRLGRGDAHLKPVMKRLLELESFCRDWTEGAFQPSSLSKVSTESQSTLEQFGDYRTFLCPDGEERVFAWHLRLTPDAWRIYFLPLPTTLTTKTLVGYIGPHLPTVSDPT